MIKSILTLFFVSTCSLSIFSQEANGIAKLSNNVIRIGEQTHLSLKVIYNSNKVKGKIVWPTIQDTLTEKIEVVSKDSLQVVHPDANNPNYTEEQLNLVVTSFDSGFHAVPPFVFLINNDSATRFETEALLLQVNTVKADTALPIKDIAPPLEEPFAFEDAVPFLLAIVFVGVIVVLIIYWLKKRNQKKPIVKKEIVPPHIKAINRLNEIKDGTLWKDGKLKIYYSVISETLREYLESTQPINAMELTTEEIVERLKRINIRKENKELLKQVLFLSDMVKFAKEQPVQEEHENAWKMAYEFIVSTSNSEVEEKQNG